MKADYSLHGTQIFNVFFYFRNVGKIKKTLKNMTRIKKLKNFFYICALQQSVALDIYLIAIVV